MFENEVIIALGTHNQAKRAAVVLATGVEPICHSVPSGVSDQPLSEDETIRGAINRAKHVLEAAPKAQIGLGLEGGLTYDPIHTNQWYLFSVCAAWDGMQLFVGKGLYFPIPNSIGEKLKQGETELRHIIDELSSTVGSNHKEGAYGLFTDGRITRTEVFREAVIAALTPFQSSFISRIGLSDSVAEVGSYTKISCISSATGPECVEIVDKIDYLSAKVAFCLAILDKIDYLSETAAICLKIVDEIDYLG